MSMQNPLSLREWLQQQPYTLAMSSGFFGFFAHCGVISALEEEQLYPQRLAGSSAGALISGVWATGLHCQDIKQELLQISRQDFWDPYPGMGLLRGKRFFDKLTDLLPTTDFAACKIPVVISVYNTTTFSTTALQSGNLARAIQASCAVPAMFHPVKIEGVHYLDGGIADHGGLGGIPLQERVFYHHLGSIHHNKCFPRVPQRPNMTTMVINDLPSVGPFRLEKGKQAYEHAYHLTKKALSQPVAKNICLG